MGKLGFSFSWKRLLGITSTKQKIARKTGVPTTKTGLYRKIGKFIVDFLAGIFGAGSSKKKK